MKEGQAYKRSFRGITMKIQILENGRVVDKVCVADTVELKKVMTKYSLRA